MEPSFSKYIWTHTRRHQIWILVIVAISMIPYYLAFDLPKQIVNGPIMGGGFDDGTEPFMPASLDIPYYGTVNLVGGYQLGRMESLIGLSIAFLSLVIINGLFKYYINTFKGLLGERLLRRIRFELVDRILRFRPSYFKHVKGAEVSSMVKDEVEPLGSFTGDAFVQPALLGGQAVTALAFIFVQNIWLGMVAFVMAGVQFLIIPRLRRRLIELGRERQLTARQLAGRVNEIVEGINTIHAYDTSNYERADISTRLGTIFRIRYEIYQRKFMVKFLNNFLAQLTPFLFYLIGGYLAIQGKLDVGQLVAVINAYKELPGPLKELIDWDLQRQDVQVKYEQVVDQFSSEEFITSVETPPDAERMAHIAQPLILANLTLEDDSGSKRLEHVSMRIEPGERIGIVGDSNSGADAVAEAFARIAWPTSGRVTAGEDDLFIMPESLTGQRISYASSDTYFFFGTLRDNLLYGLKHRPVTAVEYTGKAARRRKWQLNEAEKSGNPDFDLDSDWINTADAHAVTDEDGILGAIMAVLDVVRMSDQVLEFALHSTFENDDEPELTDRIVRLRHEFREELHRQGLSNLVVPFEAGSYNSEARVVDNLLFGVLTGVKDQAGLAEGTAFFNRTIEESGLGKMLFDMGLSIAETTLELFQDLPPDHPFFERLSYMSADDIPRFQAMVQRLRNHDYEKASPEDRLAMMQLSFLYVEPQHRFGVLSDDLMKKIVEVREAFHEGIPEHLDPLFERYDPDSYLSAGSLLDNIVFGKINLRFNDAERQVRSVIMTLLQEKPKLYRRVLSVGLDYNLGASGRRLTLVQRQKLNLGRALIRRSDYYIFNRPLSGLDPVLQEQILTDTLEFLNSDGDRPAVLWVLSSRAFAKHFDRTLVFKDHVIQEEQETDGTSKNEGAMIHKAVAE
ncbi:MAG: hypothetical protein DI533_13445 [Cereibacter sphaeroides]|uniref:ABC transporter ATP-binding protein n=1 Tax=Cereibacter sphaeroides TaxID=1063 RepID=A0A2W5SBM3_CERSP|nr:MAG: hypothetical protein DI533_13445 [Cereibacter sphaeroides]